MEFRINLHSRRKYPAGRKLFVVESLPCAALDCSTQTYSQLIPCLQTSHPTQALPTELWFNNPCISSDLQEQFVELQEKLQRHNCRVNVPVPQLKWFMQHLVTMMSAITWLSSLNQSLKHYTEFVYQSKPPNATYPSKLTDLYSPEKLSITRVLVKRSWGENTLAQLVEPFHTILLVSNHCEMLEDVCPAWMPDTIQRTTCWTNCSCARKAAVEVLHKAWYGSKPIGSSANASSM